MNRSRRGASAPVVSGAGFGSGTGGGSGADVGARMIASSGMSGGVSSGFSVVCVRILTYLAPSVETRDLRITASKARMRQ